MSPLRSAELKSFRNRRLALPYQRKSGDNPKSLTDRIGRQIQRGYNPDVRLRGLVYAQHAIASAPVGCEIRFGSQPVIVCTRMAAKTTREALNRRKSRVDVGRYVIPESMQTPKEFSTLPWTFRRLSSTDGFPRTTARPCTLRFRSFSDTSTLD
jgi:hypothetical protein